jgi:hypothetical protein
MQHVPGNFGTRGIELCREEDKRKPRRHFICRSTYSILSRDRDFNHDNVAL